MTWFAQVRHVMAKDVRQARWFLIAYGSVVLLATAHALQWPGASNGILDTSMFMVVVTGMFLVASFIQADSPFRSDAFWASRPFHPMAMLVAKLSLATLVVMVPALTGQLAALADNAVPMTSLLTLAGRSVWMYALWLLVAMLLAAMTRDVRGFTTALVAVSVTIAFGAL
jgi:hypothetical protein